MAQARGGYRVDLWMDLTLEPMLKLWQGVGNIEHPSYFFLSEEDAREAKGDYEGTKPFKFAQTLWRLAQVEPHATLSFRQEIEEFVVNLPVAAAIGVCTANHTLGSGSVFQYYIPNWDQDERIFRTGRRFKFDAKAYP